MVTTVVPHSVTKTGEHTSNYQGHASTINSRYREPIWNIMEVVGKGKGLHAYNFTTKSNIFRSSRPECGLQKTGKWQRDEKKKINQN